jgi:pre-mRNA-splicing factor CWC22
VHLTAAAHGWCSVYDRFRHVMHEGDVDKRVQYTIEALFLVRKTGFETAGFPAVPPELDLVEPEDQITHEVGYQGLKATY